MGKPHVRQLDARKIVLAYAFASAIGGDLAPLPLT